jgi:hypothetical protein
MYQTIYKTPSGNASIQEHRETKALQYLYKIDSMRFCFSIWAEVGERAVPLFAPFWREKGITNPLDLPSVDHGPDKPYISDRLP